MTTIPITIAVVYVVFFTITDGGFGWVREWFAWALYFATVGALLLIGRRKWVAAGATWLQYEKTVLNFYELVSIDWKASGASRVLDIADSNGSRIRSLPLRELQENQALWDLVYNGILHSAMSGQCHVSDRAIKFLHLPEQLYRHS